ncbi:Casparian strip membrane protein domain - like 10 [Theobroma cacao]|nr:Casparian strip membrane protein domain - like 10 [Theobroma cacao]
MKELIGSPGTVSGLTLRIAQCAFAAASIGVMVSTSDFSTYTAFWYKIASLLIFHSAVLIFRCTMSLGKEKKLVRLGGVGRNRNALYLIASMGLQLLWSFGLACLDVYALRRKRDLQNPVLVSLFVVGDWVTAMLSLAAACSSAGVIVLYARDLDFCRAQAHLPCRRYEISIILAFITWVLIAMSSHVMFWILASF